VPGARSSGGPIKGGNDIDDSTRKEKERNWNPETEFMSKLVTP
jgi:hypothetical protein